MAFLCTKLTLVFIISVNFDRICHVNFKNKPIENSPDQKRLIALLPANQEGTGNSSLDTERL